MSQPKPVAGPQSLMQVVDVRVGDERVERHVECRWRR
jgi:hypothetical protein